MPAAVSNNLNQIDGATIGPRMGLYRRTKMLKIELAMKLLKKLSKSELAALCDFYDDSGLEWLFCGYLLPQDKKNRPDIYRPNEGECLAKKD